MREITVNEMENVHGGCCCEIIIGASILIGAVAIGLLSLAAIGITVLTVAAIAVAMHNDAGSISSSQ
ncbi:hypothetical protein XfCFBP8356_002515 [Xylella fastidiosa subsp. sandyi]|uniref:hypothetical protein n=1 Tax=Xylella fastidiosa TaxID=2371 RepID=UPI0009C12FFA|nr:hypothetical protein [Xylella fastidiosa]RWA45053.1 hypothetical protein XfCFBP8356_03405 [Xylella fastidiosa subsp. sandyi]WNY19535.1 hypothetical protein RO839_02535 [Xylella fastidiosa]WNY21827.1 hypothetical protein RO838_02545 [Xylella fastidiosa]